MPKTIHKKESHVLSFFFPSRGLPAKCEGERTVCGKIFDKTVFGMVATVEGFARFELLRQCRGSSGTPGLGRTFPINL